VNLLASRHSQKEKKGPDEFGALLLYAAEGRQLTRVEVRSQPDRDEVIAKRNGVTVRWGRKEAWSKDTGRWKRTGFAAYGVGRAGN
jgi:hypothetical protein